MNRLYEVLPRASGILDRPALSAGRGAGSRTLSYRELLGWAEAVAEELRIDLARRSRPTEPVFVLAERGFSQVIGLLACLRCEVPAAILDGQQGAARLQDILAQVTEPLVLCDALGQKQIASLGLDAVRSRVITDAPSGEPVVRSVVADDPVREEHVIAASAVVLFTSGSTGAPKGVCVGARDLVDRLRIEEQWFELHQNDVILGVLPLTFDVGLTQLLATFHVGAHHVLGASWLPADILGDIERHGVRGLALSPVVWRYLLRSTDEGRLWATLGGLRYVTLSGGTLPRNLLERIRDHLGQTTFVKTYGQTEMFRIAAQRVGQHAERLDSVGQAYPGVTIRVRRDDGSEALPREVGEITADGLGRMVSYLGEATESSGARPREPARTGDQGYLDEDGYLYVQGRKDDMIKILDRRVFPADVARLCREILGHSELEVVGVRSEDPFLALFVRTDEPAQAGGRWSQREVLGLLRQRLGSQLLPRHVILLAELPHTSSGKVDFVGLQKLALERSGSGGSEGKDVG
jgi:acyl-coenzyme A synthetase/AMP-(fatty) acid ligase